MECCRACGKRVQAPRRGSGFCSKRCEEAFTTGDSEGRKDPTTNSAREYWDSPDRTASEHAKAIESLAARAAQLEAEAACIREKIKGHVEKQRSLRKS